MSKHSRVNSTFYNINSFNRSFFKQGGEATTDEMCISFLFYYPRMPLDGCLAEPLFDTFPEVRNKTAQEQVKFFDEYDWEDRHARLIYKKNIEKTKYRSSCYARNPSFVSFVIYISLIMHMYNTFKFCFWGGRRNLP